MLVPAVAVYTRLLYTGLLTVLRMPDLNRKYFDNPSEISAERVADLVTGCSEAAIRGTLTKLGWEGQAVASVILKISADGKQVTSGHFQLEGALSPTPIVIQASKLWEKADSDIVLSVEVPSGNAFVFEGGRLTSDFLDHETVKYKFSRGGQVLAETERTAGGVGHFCMRILAHLGKTSNGAAGPNIKFTMLVLPQSASDTLEMSAAAQSPAWPGIKALEGTCQLFPPSKLGEWGAPCFPLLNTKSISANCSELPGAEHLRFALAGVMRTAARPTGCTSYGGLMKYTSRMMKDPEAAAPSEPSITWPDTARPANTGGRSSFRRLTMLFCFSFTLSCSTKKTSRYSDAVALISSYKRMGRRSRTLPLKY